MSEPSDTDEEIVMYIVVNEDLKKMKSGKLAAQVAQCVLCSDVFGTLQ